MGEPEFDFDNVDWDYTQDTPHDEDTGQPRRPRHQDLPEPLPDPRYQRILYADFVADRLCRLCAAAAASLARLPNIVVSRARTFAFVGDLHGSLASLLEVQRILRSAGFSPNRGPLAPTTPTTQSQSQSQTSTIPGDQSQDQDQDTVAVFLGDYVDRGLYSLEVLEFVLQLYLDNPGRVVLLRGNHESDGLPAVYGFLAECVSRLGNFPGRRVFEAACDLFPALPLAAVCRCPSGAVFAVHGGVAAGLSAADIAGVDRFSVTDSGQDATADAVLWSDPSPTDTDGPNTDRGCGDFFSEATARGFLASVGCCLLVRAHQACDGVEFAFNGKDPTDGPTCVTVFSSAGYEGFSNRGAVLVDRDNVFEVCWFDPGAIPRLPQVPR